MIWLRVRSEFGTGKDSKFMLFCDLGCCPSCLVVEGSSVATRGRHDEGSKLKLHDAAEQAENSCVRLRVSAE